MTAHDRIRLTGPFAEFTWINKRQPRLGTYPDGADHLGANRRG